MPIPHFLICCKGHSIDRDSRSLSVFEIVDLMNIVELPKPESNSILFVEEQRFSVISAWIIDTKNGETYDDEFELKMTFKLENEPPIREHVQKFKFTDNRPAHRMIINMLGTLPLKHSGIMHIEATAKKVGSQNSKTQSYRVFVEYQKADDIAGGDAPVKQVDGHKKKSGK